MPIIFRAQIFTRHKTRHRHFTRHFTRQLGILLGGIGIHLGILPGIIFMAFGQILVLIPSSLTKILS